MKYTENYNLKIPEGNDLVNIKNISENFEMMDSIIGGTIPPRVILPYLGEVAPSGWAICDGTNGTPDLRGRFLFGKIDFIRYSQYEVSASDVKLNSWGDGTQKRYAKFKCLKNLSNFKISIQINDSNSLNNTNYNKNRIIVEIIKNGESIYSLIGNSDWYNTIHLDEHILGSVQENDIIEINTAIYKQTLNTVHLYIDFIKFSMVENGLNKLIDLQDTSLFEILGITGEPLRMEQYEIDHNGNSNPKNGKELQEIGGEAEHILTINELAKHNHIETVADNEYKNSYNANYAYGSNVLSSYQYYYTASSASHPTKTNISPLTTAYTGGNQPHNNMPPYFTINYIMKL